MAEAPPETPQATGSTEAPAPERFVEQTRPRVHVERDGRRAIDWMKHEREGEQCWCELYQLPLAHRHFNQLAGVYVIWHSGHNPVVRVGQGYIQNELTTLCLDARMLSRNTESTPFVTRAAVPREQRDGIGRYLADMLKPQIVDQVREVVPIAVNLPC